MNVDKPSLDVSLHATTLTLLRLVNSETHMSGSSELVDMGADYTSFTSG
jgi:hypothetical protein